MSPAGVTGGRGTLLRRSASQVCHSKPAPPARRTPSMVSEDAMTGSNSSTPRGSTEFLPPPPPHLLCSDEEEEGGGGVAHKRTVAESIAELQRRQSSTVQGSPGTLRRVQSLSGAGDRSQLMARLDTVLSHPRPASPAPQPRPPQTDQIYAPVAALQQKIQQQQQARLHGEPGSVPHPPGPALHTSTFSSGQQEPSSSSEYGFGMQFQVQQKNFHQQHQSGGGQQQQYQRSYSQPGYPGQYPSHHPHHHQQQDQIMVAMDPTLSQRPHPPELHQTGRGWPAPAQSNGQPGLQSAMKVRHWIETRTVSDVRAVRPVLNREIQAGLQLRKAAGVRDRSGPQL